MLAGTSVVLAVFCASKIPPVPSALFVGTTTLGVVVAGFTATQRNMLLSMGGSKVMRFAAVTGYYKDILAYLAECIYAALFVAVISFVGVFIADDTLFWRYWLALWAGSVVFVLVLMVRNERLMSRVFGRFMEEQGSRKN